MLQTVVFLIVAIALYWVSDRILLKIEAARGAPFEERSAVFFAILLVLALASFWGLNQLSWAEF